MLNFMPRDNGEAKVLRISEVFSLNRKFCNDHNQRMGKKPITFSELCFSFGSEGSRENGTKDDSCYLRKRFALRRGQKSSADESALLRSGSRRPIDSVCW